MAKLKRRLMQNTHISRLLNFGGLAVKAKSTKYVQYHMQSLIEAAIKMENLMSICYIFFTSYETIHCGMPLDEAIPIDDTMERLIEKIIKIIKNVVIFIYYMESLYIMTPLYHIHSTAKI